MATQAAENPKPRIPDHVMYKNRLQEYAQRSALPLPSYHTVNEGLPHEPKFRSTVLVDGVPYTSQTFLHRKEAEQNAAKIAMEAILKKIKEQGCPILNEDMSFCKSILNEFAVKLSLEMPEYTTIQAEGILPTFVSTVVFHGKTYTGNPCRNKKEAEQVAARNAIQSILGTDSGPILSQLVNAKRKLFAVVHRASDNNGSLIGHSQPSAQVANVSAAQKDVPPMKKPKLECGETSCGATPNVTPAVEKAATTVAALTVVPVAATNVAPLVPVVPVAATNVAPVAATNVAPLVAPKLLSQSISVDQAGLTDTRVNTKARKHLKKKNKKKGEEELLVGERLTGAHPLMQSSTSLVAQ